MADSVELIVMACDDEKGAGKTLHALRELEKEHSIRLFDAAVVGKDHSGKTKLEETRDVGLKRGAFFGALIGGVIGLVGGPAGAVLGAAAGAATGGVAARKIDLGFSDDFLDELKGSLRPGTSVLLAIVEPEWIEQVIEELERHPGKLLRHALRDDIAEQLATLQPDTEKSTKIAKDYHLWE